LSQALLLFDVKKEPRKGSQQLEPSSAEPRRLQFFLFGSSKSPLLYLETIQTRDEYRSQTLTEDHAVELGLWRLV